MFVNEFINSVDKTTVSEVKVGKMKIIKGFLKNGDEFTIEKIGFELEVCVNDDLIYAYCDVIESLGEM